MRTLATASRASVAAFIAWQRRDRILALDYHPAGGDCCDAWAALQVMWATLARNCSCNGRRF